MPPIRHIASSVLPLAVTAALLAAAIVPFREASFRPTAPPTPRIADLLAPLERIDVPPAVRAESLRPPPKAAQDSPPGSDGPNRIRAGSP
jgi:hypothetical protein